MTKRIGNNVIIGPEEKDICEYCGILRELRPYGKNNAMICFECGMKNEKETRENMMKILYGENKSNGISN